MRRYHSRSLDVAALPALFCSHPNVEYAEPNCIVRSTAAPNDPGFAQLWGLQNQFQIGADIGAVAAGASGVGIVSTTMGNTYSSFRAPRWRPYTWRVPQHSCLSRCQLDTAGLKNILLNSVDHLSTLTGFTATGGRLNVNTAIRTCASSPVPPPTVTVPAAPSGLAATSGSGKKKIALTWTASSGATSYIVSRSTTSGGPYSVVATSVTGTSYQNTGLSSGSAYFYVVAANNAAGSSGYSNEASATAK